MKRRSFGRCVEALSKVFVCESFAAFVGRPRSKGFYAESSRPSKNTTVCIVKNTGPTQACQGWVWIRTSVSAATSTPDSLGHKAQVEWLAKANRAS